MEINTDNYNYLYSYPDNSIYSFKLYKAKIGKVARDEKYIAIYTIGRHYYNASTLDNLISILDMLRKDFYNEIALNEFELDIINNAKKSMQSLERLQKT